jgi:hypothetical protein
MKKAKASPLAAIRAGLAAAPLKRGGPGCFTCLYLPADVRAEVDAAMRQKRTTVGDIAKVLQANGFPDIRLGSLRSHFYRCVQETKA